MRMTEKAEGEPVMKKYIYTFGDGNAEGGADQKELLGGKGANLAEMAGLGLPVPAGFTISTQCCNDYMKPLKKWGMKAPTQRTNPKRTTLLSQSEKKQPQWE